MPEVVGSLRPPRLPTSGRPASPALGELYYDTVTNILYYWDGAAWVSTKSSAVTIYDSDYVGTVKTFSGRVIPTNWMLADGRSLLRGDYPDLFAAIGTQYGAVDGTHFNIPDYRGKFLYGSADAALADIGTAGGEAAHALTLAELAAHAHTVNSHSHGGATGNAAPGTDVQGSHQHPRLEEMDPPAWNLLEIVDWNPGAGVINTGLKWGTAGASVFGVQNFVGTKDGVAGAHGHNVNSHGHGINAEAPGTNNQGSGTAHNNLPPYILVAHIIKVTGPQINAGGALQGATGAAGVDGAKGDPGPWRGVWNAATAYNVGDSVSYYDGQTTGSYRRKVAGTTAGNPKTDTTNWEVIASGGSIGVDGAVAVYEQAGAPATTAVGALWIDTDEVPPAFGPTIPLVSSLPSPAYDGQEVYLLVDATNGIVWHMRYRAASTSAYKWEFVGGAPLEPPQTASLNPLTAYATVPGLTVTLPRSGDYKISFGSAAYASNAGATINIAIKRGAAATADTDGFRLQFPSANLVTAGHAWSKIFTGCVAADVYALQAKISVNNGNIEGTWLSILPVRLS